MMDVRLDAATIIKNFRSTMMNGVTTGDTSSWGVLRDLEVFVPFVIDVGMLCDGAHVEFDDSRVHIEVSQVAFSLPFERCMFVFGEFIVLATQTAREEVLFQAYILVPPRSFTSILEIGLSLSGATKVRSKNGVAEVPNGVSFAHFANGFRNQAEISLCFVLRALHLLDSKSTFIEPEEYPDHVQASRRKHGKPLLPAIRHIRPASNHVKWGREGSHSPKSPHDRRGNWATLCDGRQVWRRPSKINGGGEAPPTYVVEPPPPTIWPEG